MPKPLATDKFMRLNGHSMWVAGEAEGERQATIKEALRVQGDDDEGEIQAGD